MSKRLAIVFFIVIASCIFAVAGFCLMLFLAPGFSAFGLKYIRTDIHVVNTGKIQIAETKDFKTSGGFNGDLIIETTEVPINIIFSQDFDFYFAYFDNFVGLTTSDFDDPSVSISKNEHGDCIIKTQEFEKFIYESSSSKRYLNVYVPLYIVGDTAATIKNLTINTESSPITFSKEKEDIRTASFNKVTINTESSKVVFESNFHAVNFNYQTNNTIRIYGDPEKEVYATNYDLESRSGKIVIKGDVVGNVTAKTKNGDITLESCKNLYVETKCGDIECSNKESKVEIRGIAKITTTAGRVIIGEIKGNGDNQITTGGGSVTIDKLTDATITTKRGAIRVKSVNTAKITSNVGNVYVEEALSSIDVETQRGKIELGGEGLTVNNPHVYSRIGRVYLKTGSGKVYVETINSDIEFTNKDSNDIEIIGGKKVKASRLTGAVHIVSNGDTELKFVKITKETVVELGDKCYNATIRAEQNTARDTDFYLSGKYVVRYEDDAPVKKGENGTVIGNDYVVEGDASIKVTGKNADIHVYFKKP